MLPSLSDVSVDYFGFKASKPSLILLFEKDCIICKKQVKELLCLPPKVEVLLLGSFSLEKDLRLEYKKMNSPFPGYYGNQSVLKFFGITKKLTPQMVLFNGNSRQLLLGFHKCATIKKWLFGKKDGRKSPENFKIKKDEINQGSSPGF